MKGLSGFFRDLLSRFRFEKISHRHSLDVFKNLALAEHLVVRRVCNVLPHLPHGHIG